MSPTEHPHPAPVQDCYAGLVRTDAHAAESGIWTLRLDALRRALAATDSAVG